MVTGAHGRSEQCCRRRSKRTALPSGKAVPKFLCSAVLLLVALSHAQPSFAGGCYPFQASLFPPLQIAPRDESVCGARLDLLWGQNASVNGLDAGIVNVADSMKGLEVGGLNWLWGQERSDSWGIRIGGINYTGHASFAGAQFGLINTGSFLASEASLAGVQVAGINLYVGSVSGTQFGLVNAAGGLSGLQVGFVNNSADDVRGVQVGIFVNDTSGDVRGAQISLIGNEAIKDVYGVQIGLINVCHSLSGVQIGALNVVTSRFPNKGLFISPLINVGF